MQNEDMVDRTPATKGNLASIAAELKGDIAATKAELKGDIAATKAELKGDIAATRAELKADLAATTRTLALEIVKTNARLDQMHESFSAQLTEGVSKVLKTAEDFMSQVLKVDRRQIIMDWRVDGLEKRVSSLETRAP